MSEEVSWSLELTIKPGQIDVVRTLIPEMVDSTQNEPGALMYEWSISDDESAIHSYERYADSEAVLEHLSTFGESSPSVSWQQPTRRASSFTAARRIGPERRSTASERST